MRKYTIDKLTGVCTAIEKNPSQYSGRAFMKYLERELSRVPGGLDGLYKVGEQWRSERLDVEVAV